MQPAVGSLSFSPIGARLKEDRSGDDHEENWLVGKILGQMGEEVKRAVVCPAIPNEELLMTREPKSVSVGHRIQGGNDDQTAQDGPDDRPVSRIMAEAD